MSHRQVSVVLLIAMLLGFPALSTATAQEAPASPTAGSAPIGVLTTFSFASLPSPHAEVWFLRYSLEPGGSLPADKQIGPTIFHVEDGTLTVVSDRAVLVSGAGEIATPGAQASPTAAAESETVLSPGQSVLVEDGTLLAARNDGEEPVTFLVLLMFSGEREGESSTGVGEPVGLTQQGISVAAAEFPDGPYMVTIERVLVAAGDTLESDSGHGAGIGGLDLGAVEQGSARTTFQTGSSWLWPHILVEFADRQPIDPGATIDLTAGDGYSTYDGSSNWIVTRDAPLVLLRAVLMPDN